MPSSALCPARRTLEKGSPVKGESPLARLPLICVMRSPLRRGSSPQNCPCSHSAPPGWTAVMSKPPSISTVCCSLNEKPRPAGSVDLRLSDFCRIRGTCAHPSTFLLSQTGVPSSPSRRVRRDCIELSSFASRGLMPFISAITSPVASAALRAAEPPVTIFLM